MGIGSALVIGVLVGLVASGKGKNLIIGFLKGFLTFTLGFFAVPVLGAVAGVTFSLVGCKACAVAGFALVLAAAIVIQVVMDGHWAASKVAPGETLAKKSWFIVPVVLGAFVSAFLIYVAPDSVAWYSNLFY